MSTTAWTPNDYSNMATVGAAALCSVLLIVFKSRCTEISLCWGLFGCKRKVPDSAEDDDETQPVNPPQQPQQPNNPIQQQPPQQD